MDSEHRHELEENALAKWLEREIKAIKPQLPLIIGILIAIGAGIFGYNAWKNYQEQEVAKQWRDFSVAVTGQRPDLDTLQSAIEDNPGTDVEEWSKITLADGKTFQASLAFMTDRAKSEELLAEAEEVYNLMLDESNVRDIKGRANFGLARIHEMRGELDKASEQYNKVQGMFKEIATERAEYLTSDVARSNSEWLNGVVAATTTETDTEEDTVDPEETIDTDAALDDLLRGAVGSSEETDDEASQEKSGDESSEKEEATEEETTESSDE